MKKINSQNLLAISVLLVSITSVLVAIFQANIMKEQQSIMHRDFEASLWPHVELTANYKSGKAFEIIVENKGVGPAFIEGISIKNSQGILKNWSEVQKIIAVDSVPVNSMSSSSIIGNVISAGEEKIVFAIYQKESAERLFELYNEMEIIICYKSVYDTYWHHHKYFADNRTISKNEKLDQCDIPSFEAFNDDVYELTP